MTYDLFSKMIKGIDIIIISLLLFQVVKLRFTNFDLEDVYPCWYAYVDVYDGSHVNNEELISKYCGRQLPEVTHTTTHEMYVQYISLSQGAGSGFDGVVEFIQVNCR